MNDWKLTKQMEADWTKDRPTVEVNNTLYRLMILLHGEVAVLAPAICHFLIDPTPDKHKEVLQEAADVGLFLMAIFRLLDADMLEEISEKVAVNHLRYPSAQFQEGDYTQTYKRLKPHGKEIKKEFYQIPEPL